jgi:hypothetical protein
VNQPRDSGVDISQISPNYILPVPRRSETTKRNKRGESEKSPLLSPYKKQLMIGREEKRKEKGEERKNQEVICSKKAKKQNERRSSHTQEIRCPGCDKIYQDPPNEDWIPHRRVNCGGMKIALLTKIQQNSGAIFATDSVFYL